MGQLIMAFRGLCIHVKKGPWLTATNVGHRVVAVDASQGKPKTKAWPELPAHFCFIEADRRLRHELEREGIPKRLDGWNLQVTNAIGPALNVSLEKTPSLSKYFEGTMVLRKDLGEENGAPKKAACFVDMQFGTVTDEQFALTDDPANGGVYTVWTVETKGDPELRFVSRDGKVVNIKIPSTPDGTVQSDGVPGSLVLHNSTRDLTDKDFDFVLNYLASADGIPKRLKEGFPGQEDQQPSGAYVGMGTSCSNSAYP